MKEKIGIFIVSVLCAVVCSLVAITIVEQNDWLPATHQNNFDEGDSVKVAQMFEQLQSPQMYAISDVIELQTSMVEKTTVDELFMSIPPDVVRTVANVLLNTDGFVTKESLVKEYRANDKIYNNLPTAPESSDSSEVDLGATDMSSRPDKTISSSFKRRVDTINGKPVHVVTETTERYE